MPNFFLSPRLIFPLRPFTKSRRTLAEYMLLLCSLSIFLFALSLSAHAKTVNVRLVLLCDIYEMEASGGRGGLARIAALVKAQRAQAQHTLVVHAGDAISPSLMSGFDYGAHMINLLNKIKPDIFVPGNHEFDFGPEVFKKRMAEAHFPLMAANLRDEKGKRLQHFTDGKIIAFDGVKLGVFGLTAENSVTKSSPGKLQFSSSLPVAQRMAAHLRKQGADLVIAVAHAGRQTDWKLLKQGGIDVLLSGDDHDLLVSYDGKSVLAEAKQDGEYIVSVDLQIGVTEKHGKRRTQWWPNFQILDTGNVTPDAEMRRHIAVYKKQLSKDLDVPLGTITTPLDSRSSQVRSRETAIGNLIADAMRTAVGADMTLINGGGIRGNRQYPAGHVLTRRDVLTELPFRNLTLMLEMTGAQIRKALENGLATAEAEFGKFPQVSGLQLVADLSRPPGKRLLSLKIGGKPARDDKRYKVATNDYIARGREGYDVFRHAKRLIGKFDAKYVANDVMVYVRKAKQVSSVVEGRMILKK